MNAKKALWHMQRGETIIIHRRRMSPKFRLRNKNLELWKQYYGFTWLKLDDKTLNRVFNIFLKQHAKTKFKVMPEGWVY